MNKCIFLILISLLSLSSCKKDKFPSTPTIITGIVVDENNNPIEGYEFQFSGFDKTGLVNGNPTFNLYKTTDKQGLYKFSQIISSNTDLVEFQPIGLKLPNGNYDEGYKDINVFENGKYINSASAGPIEYGTTNTFNFQVLKINK